jgi:hypothetical protein
VVHKALRARKVLKVVHKVLRGVLKAHRVDSKVGNKAHKVLKVALKVHKVDKVTNKAGVNKALKMAKVLKVDRAPKADNKVGNKVVRGDRKWEIRAVLEKNRHS